MLSKRLAKKIWDVEGDRKNENGKDRKKKSPLCPPERTKIMEKN